jgi:pyrimidine dimer DNA glycosylase
VALWREALLARHVLAGKTVGYRFHPQLERFRACSAPLASIDMYLLGVYGEALARGYDFNRDKFRKRSSRQRIAVTEGQLEYEWSWLMRKLRSRNPALYRLHRQVAAPQLHPLFRLRPGPVASWERV